MSENPTAGPSTVAEPASGSGPEAPSPATPGPEPATPGPEPATLGPGAPVPATPAKLMPVATPSGVVWTAPPPRPPGFLQKYWPGPGATAPPLAVLAIVVTAVVAAAAIPLDRPGVGWLGTGVVAAIALGLLASRPVSAPDRMTKVWRRIWGGGTLALLAVGTVRAAGWVFVLCVLTALVTASLALGNGSTVLGLARAALAVPFAALRGLPWGIQGLSAVRRRDGSSAVRLLLTVLASGLLLLIFGALFASADAAFASILGNVLPEIDADTVARWIFVGCVVGLGMLGAAYLVLAPPKLDGAAGEPDAEPAPRARLRRLEWLVPVALLDLMFLGFVIVQLTVLFGGARHVLSTANLTYAEYARGGFWQLLAVTVLTLLVLGAGVRWASRERLVDRVLVRVVLGALALLTLVIVASALYRMSVYEEAYGFTRLRVFVTVVELWLGAVFVMVLIAGVARRSAWPPRAIALSAVVALLGLAVANPDWLIAQRNIDRYQQTGRIDADYLRSLSSDAAPAMERLSKTQRDCALGQIAADLRDDPDDWREFNVSRMLARRQLAAEPVTSTADCRFGQ